MAVKDWSTTASSNTAILAGISTDGSVMTVSQVDNAIREMAAQIASQLGKLGFKGADIASATTTNLANATGWYVDITGTTTITGLGTVDAGQMFMLRFAGALTFTHNATSLILPGAANITTVAGDVAIVVSLGSGNWKCVNYMRAGGAPISAASTITEAISGIISVPANKSYTLVLKAPFAGTITETVTISASGTCTATFKVNSTALGGTANSVSSSEQAQAHAATNTFAAGDDIVVTVSSNSACLDMSYTIKFTRALS